MTKKIGIDATSINKNHNGGKNQVCLNLLRGFEKNGVADRMVVFCIPEAEMILKNLIPHARVVSILNGKKFNERLKYLWIRSIIIPRYLNEFNIGVLLFPTFGTGIRKYSVPTVVIPHDIQTQTHKERFSALTSFRMALNYYFDFKLRDRIVAISCFDKNELIATYPDAEKKVIQFYNPIYSDIFSFAPRCISEIPYITAVNIQFKHKNIITLLKAFEKIKDSIPHQLLLIGRLSSDTEPLMEFVKEHNLSNRVEFLGFLDDSALAETLKNSDLFVNPSTFEGFGMTAVEAMLSGVPTLVSKVSATYEVTMGLCYYYQTPDNVEALSESMKSILSDKSVSISKELALISATIDARYNYAKISRQYFELLLSLI